MCSLQFQILQVPEAEAQQDAAFTHMHQDGLAVQS